MHGLIPMAHGPRLPLLERFSGSPAQGAGGPSIADAKACAELHLKGCACKYSPFRSIVVRSREAPLEDFYKDSGKALSRGPRFPDPVPPQVDLVFAAAAGVLTASSPCGVPFLPVLWVQQSRRAARGPRPALVLGEFLLGAGLFIVPFGTLASLAAAAVRPLAPSLVLLSGFVVLGIAILNWKGGSFLRNPLGFLRRLAGPRAEPAAMGFAYAMGAVGCTSPIFLAVLLFAVSSSQPVLLLAFTLSFLLPLALLATLAREFGDAFRDTMRRHAYLLERGMQVFLFGLGLYLIAFFFAGPFLGLPP